MYIPFLLLPLSHLNPRYICGLRSILLVYLQAATAKYKAMSNDVCVQAIKIRRQRHGFTNARLYFDRSRRFAEFNNKVLSQIGGRDAFVQSVSLLDSVHSH